jgi:hypothetical protein
VGSVNENAISLVQLPVIREQLAPLSAEIDREVTEALSLAVTPETLAQVKRVRAKIRKDFDELETQRKSLKSAIMAKYEEFEREVYKPLISIRVEEGDAELKRKISSVEGQLKQEKEDDLRDYFRELADSEHLDWLDFARGGFNVTLSKSRTALHKEADEFVGRVANDTVAINAMPDAEEVLVEYKRTLRLGEAVETVSKRHKAIEQERREREHLAEMRRREEEAAERAREAARENPVVTAPKKVEAQTVEKLTLSFSVTDTRERLKLLKSFLDGNHYQYE